MYQCVLMNFSQEVNNVTLSDVIDKILREFLVNPEDVIFLSHDSASYMSIAAARLRLSCNLYSKC